MKRRLIFLISVALTIDTLYSQALFLLSPSLDKAVDTYPGLASNVVTQIFAQGDSTIWFGTGSGLSRTDDFGGSFISYYAGVDSIPKGGVSAIDVLDSIIWIATVFDSTTMLGKFQTGGGLAYSKDEGKSWVYIPQPVDNLSDTIEYWGGHKVRFLPITTSINNTTWDISVTPEYVYIVSWAGGLRRTKDFGRTWERIPLPSDKVDILNCGDSIQYEINPNDPPKGNHNHKGFSVLAYGDTIWVGTANGINLGILQENGCISWRKYTAQNSGISGNFVVEIERQIWGGRETIWAVTLPAEGPDEYMAISKTSDGGLTWRTTLSGERGYNVAFFDSAVYVCTERGLFKSIDGGENWAMYNPPDNIFSHNVYSSFVDTREGLPYLWIGTADGIAKTSNDGLRWETYRTSLSTNIPGQPAIYAYPNPFSPTRHNLLNDEGHVRVQFYLDSPAYVHVEIYDFSMCLVYKGEKHYIPTIGDHCEVWNGRNRSGDLVANGTYFCRVVKSHDSKEESLWTKLIIIK